MIGLLWPILAILISPCRSNARLEAENAVLRHQLLVLRRKCRGRVRLTNFHRWIFVQLYRLFPSVLQVLHVIRPETLVRWHRAGFCSYWRWKSRNRGGRPQIHRDLRALIMQMTLENPLWGAPRIHGELLKLGFQVAQSTVAKYMVKGQGRPPGQSWWTFLRNHTPEIAAMDLFVVPTLAFSLLYGFIIVRLDRRELVWIGVTNSPTAEWIARQITEAFPWGFSTGIPHPRPRSRLRSSRLPANARNEHPGQTYRTSFASAERICRATDWVYSPRMSRSRDHWRRSPPPSYTGIVRAILQRGADASVTRKRRSPNSPDPASWQSELV